MQGWPYYCTHCQHLTNTRPALEAAMEARDPASLGIVAARPHRLHIEYTDRPPQQKGN
jgi:hypothetical protein